MKGDAKGVTGRRNLYRTINEKSGKEEKIMKLPEIRKYLNKKIAVRVIAGVLTIVMVADNTGAVKVRANNRNTSDKDRKDTIEENDSGESTKKETDMDQIADELLGQISVKEGDVDKEEDVYILADANGNVNKTIVVDHLTNLKKSKTVKDSTDLEEIMNVRGKETFTKNKDELTWQADGNDIYYQGTANKLALSVRRLLTFWRKRNQTGGTCRKIR